MALKKGDIIDEYKRFPDSCGLVVKVLGGGEGFHKIFCCGHELTEEDVVPARLKKGGRKMGPNGVGVIIDERKNYKESCGLRLMIMDGGQGLQRMECCGHSMTLADEQEFTDLGIRNARMAKSAKDEPLEPSGSA
ncbi:MAG TPA: hypothetical protein VGJ57_05610 [Nitrospirales bacterium]|jgi:hypothetical protein